MCEHLQGNLLPVRLLDQAGISSCMSLLPAGSLPSLWAAPLCTATRSASVPVSWWLWRRCLGACFLVAVTAVPRCLFPRGCDGGASVPVSSWLWRQMCCQVSGTLAIHFWGNALIYFIGWNNLSNLYRNL